jgi:hypothetical protein
MQREHRLALTKKYVLLVNETPVDDILDELRQQQIVNEEQREFIARHSTQIHFSTQMKTGIIWEAHFHVFFFWVG